MNFDHCLSATRWKSYETGSLNLGPEPAPYKYRFLCITRQ